MDIEPLDYIERTAFKERKEIITKVNEIVEKVNESMDPDDYYTKSEIDGIIGDIDIPDMTNYYTKTQTDYKISELKHYENPRLNVTVTEINNVPAMVINDVQIGDIITIRAVMNVIDESETITDTITHSPMIITMVANDTDRTFTDSCNIYLTNNGTYLKIGSYTVLYSLTYNRLTIIPMCRFLSSNFDTINGKITQIVIKSYRILRGH